MGTPVFAVPALLAVAQACEVAAVVTQPDRPRGRGRNAGASAVAQVAAELGLETLKPERLNTPEWTQLLGAIKADLFAVVAYGAILKPALLSLPRLGAVNLHGSLLPEYRGASPVQRALWDGRAATGVTTLWMNEGIDTGDVIRQCWAPIASTDNGETLAARLAELGAPLLAESLMLAHAGMAPRITQPAIGSYAARLAKHDGVIDWALDAETVWNHQRSVTPWPGATTWFRDGRVQITSAIPVHRLHVDAAPGTILTQDAQGVEVACRPGVLRVLRLKQEGRAEMATPDWARGMRLTEQEHFEPMEKAT